MEFKDHFQKLNDAQKVAVKHIDGPLLVIAGPGTGKTQLLSSRVAYILENTDTKAENILCLTFTNKAAINMHERIIKLTDGGAHNVSVRTFHSFASEVMNMYPDYFWNNARLSTAPDAVQQEIIQSILASLPLNNPLALKFFGKFTMIKDVKDALKLTKEAGLTPEKLRALIQANITYIDVIENDLAEITSERLSYKQLNELQKKIEKLADQNIDEAIAPLLSLSSVIKDSLAHAIQLDEGTNKTTNTGEWKKKWIQAVSGERGMYKERAKNDWWLKLADVYEEYRKQLHSRGYYDYSDMLIEVLSVLENHPEMRADIQEKYLYVMIDEFQDTNAAQLRLAHLVADHHANNGKPNIMVVGDDDQSIFKFNGAELNNLLMFKKSYPSAASVVLTENYRSTQSILDTANTIIDQADDRLVNRDKSIHKILKAKNAPTEGEIIHYGFKTAEEQLSAISQHIKGFYTPDKSVAVIARGHESLRSIAARLLALNVPLHYEQQQNILEHPLILQVILLAEVSVGIQTGDIARVNVALSKTLQHPMWGISAKELWELAAANFYDPDWLGKLESSKNANQSSHAHFLLELANVTANETLPVAIEYLLGLRETTAGISPIYSYFAKQNDTETHEYLYGLSAIKYLRALAVEFSSSNQATLEDFTSFIELEIQNEEIITDESPFVSGQNAVSLLSVHKAKGLEFDTVYIIDAVAKNWQPRSGGRKPPSNLPLQPTGDDIDDYIRLMFVAATRAKQNLYVSSYRYDSANNEVMATPIIANVLPATKYLHNVSEVEILEQALHWPRLVNGDEKLILQSRLENYSLSVTHLLNFLDVSSGGPETYLEKNILRLPAAKTASLAHGTATHAALEYAQKLVNGGKFKLEAVQTAYKNALEKEYLSQEETARYIDHGNELLRKLFQDNFLELKKGSAPEQNITDVFIGHARLSGKLDRIDDLQNEIVVSDYKTGRPLGSFETKNTSLEIKAWKQRTQLIFYALLLQNSSRFNTADKPVVGQMIYLDADESKNLYRTYTPSLEEIERLSLLVQAVWKKIQGMELPDISKYPQDYSGVVQFENDLLS